MDFDDAQNAMNNYMKFTSETDAKMISRGSNNSAPVRYLSHFKDLRRFQHFHEKSMPKWSLRAAKCSHF